MTMYLLVGDNPRESGHIGRHVYETPRQRVRRVYGRCWRLRSKARRRLRQIEASSAKP